MNVTLNLATNALQTHRRFLAASGLIGAIAGIVFLALGWHVYSVRKADEALRVRTDQVRSELAVLVRQRGELEQFFNRPENAKLADRSTFLNSLIDEKSLNWTQMFMDLEKVFPSGVRLVSIEPSTSKGRVQIKFTVNASNDQAKLKLIRALEESPAFAEVSLNSEHHLEREAGLQMELTAVYLRA